MKIKTWDVSYLLGPCLGIIGGVWIANWTAGLLIGILSTFIVIVLVSSRNTTIAKEEGQ